MIPKKIHYCWFGGKELPELAQKCIASWKKHCPGWEIVRWDESNFDFSKYPFAEYCLKNKKWAFLSDIVRLVVIYEQGGVYLDTDVELVKPLDPLCEHEAYFGFQYGILINTGHGFGAVAGHEMVKAMLAEYLKLECDEKGDYPFFPCPELNTQPFLERGLLLNDQHQYICGAEVYPNEYFNPYEYTTGKMKQTDNTYSVHWFNQSWVKPGGKIRCILTRPFHRIFGVECFAWMKRKPKGDK